MARDFAESWSVLEPILPLITGCGLATQQTEPLTLKDFG
jgi:hypothetical protein